MDDLLQEAVQLMPHYARALWGGSLMRTSWREEAPYEDTSESWEVSTHPSGCSTANGKPLPAYIAAFGERDFYGREGVGDFPLLIKVIAPQKDLSVQVHPDDAAAQRMTMGKGKTEAWVVLEAPQNAKLIYGLSVSPDTFAKAVEENCILPSLQWIPVKAGDVINIPAGMIHALTSGVVVYEIQQNSDTTYRVYDWDRVDSQGNRRPLHVAQALEVLQPNLPYSGSVRGYAWTEMDAVRTALLCHRDFALERLEVSGVWQSGISTCYAITVVQGEGTLLTVGKEHCIQKGQSWLVPACAKQLQVQGQCTLLMGSVMQWWNMRSLVLAHGASEGDLANIAGWQNG